MNLRTRILSFENAEIAFNWLLSLMIITIPFSKAISNICLFTALALCLIISNRNDYKNFITSPFIALAALTVYLTMQAAANGTFAADVGFYKKYFYLIFLPLVILRMRNPAQLKNAAVISVNIAIIISIFKIFDFYSKFRYLPLKDDWATNFVLVLERPYMGLMCVISIIVSFDLFQRAKTYSWIYLLSIVIASAFIIFISIRTSVITIAMLAFIYIVFYSRISKAGKAALILALCAAGIILFTQSKSLQRRFFIEDNLDRTVNSTLEFEPRVIIYSCAGELMHRNDFSVFFGLPSYSGIEQNLVDCYATTVTDDQRKSYFLYRKFNSHSQFLDLYLIGGIIALLLMGTFFLWAFFRYKAHFFAVAVMVTLILVMAIENIFHRQQGCLIFTIFTAVYFREKRNNGEN